MKRLCLILLVGALASCTDELLTSPGTIEVAGNAAMVDAAHGGAPGFYFLPPLVQEPTYTGTFDATRSPEVRICALPACAVEIARFDGATKPAVKLDAEEEKYGLTWQTRSGDLDPNTHYRVGVYVDGALLGFVDLDVELTSQAAKNPAPGHVGFVLGRPLMVNFRIESAASTRVVGSLAVAPASASLVVGQGQQFTVTVRDTGGEVMICPSAIAWSSSAASVVTVNVDGHATAVAAGAATITAACGTVSGTAAVAVSEPVSTVGMLAFVRREGGMPQLWTINTDGSGLRRVTDWSGGEWEPAWSPDGSRIAYRSSQSQTGWSIYVSNADGTGTWQVTPDRDGSHPTWAPDGARIAYTDWDNSTSPAVRRIYVRRLSESSGVALPGTSGGEYPDWSPDGEWIAFVVGSDIWLRKMDGSGELRQLTNPAPYGDSYPRWSPDGTRIAFSRMYQGIYTVGVDAAGSTTGAPELLIPGTVWSPAWSPCGTRIAYVKNNEIYIRDLTTGVDHRLTNDWVTDSDPHWRPVPR